MPFDSTVTTWLGERNDLHGSVPDNSGTVLLLIDVINDFEFPRGDELLQCALPIAARLATLKRRAKAAGIPAVYVNDNFGRWQSNFQQIIDHCLQKDAQGHSFVEQLVPEKQDYFVLKPKHSGFYQTPLELLLKHLGAKRLLLTGLSTNSCVLFTANDAYMRDLQLMVPRDCVAACSSQEQENAIEEMQTMLKADVSLSTELDIDSLGKHSPE